MKTLVVTGGARGIGASIATLAAARDYRVGVLDLNLADCEALCANLPNAVPFAADVRNPDSVEQALDALGTVDVLVNNAGVLRTGPLIDHDVDDFRLVTDVNLNGVFVAAQAAAKRMRDSGGGAIINMSSVAGIHPNPEGGAYAAAKAGVIGLTQHMSVEWGEYNIRVNAIAPGFINAGMSAPFFENAAVRERREQGVPMRRLGSAEDVAECVLFLASDASSYISGQVIAVDGGVINSVLSHLPRE